MADGLYFNAMEYIAGSYCASSEATLNRPQPSSKNSSLFNKAKCKTFLVKMSFICRRIKNHFHVIGVTLSLALKQWLVASKLGNGLRITDHQSHYNGYFGIRDLSYIHLVGMTGLSEDLGRGYGIEQRFGSG